MGGKTMEKYKKNKVREFIGDHIRIDGRMIDYRLVTADDYLQAKYNFTEKQLDDYREEHGQIYDLITQIMALKQSCFLMRRVSHSCGSLSDGLYYLKIRLIHELRDSYHFEFDEQLVEEYGK